MVCADDVNILGENKSTIKKSTEALLEHSREVGLDINTRDTMYVYVLLPKCRTNSHFSEKCGKDQISWNNSKKSKLHS